MLEAVCSAFSSGRWRGRSSTSYNQHSFTTLLNNWRLSQPIIFVKQVTGRDFRLLRRLLWNVAPFSRLIFARLHGTTSQTLATCKQITVCNIHLLAPARHPETNYCDRCGIEAWRPIRRSLACFVMRSLRTVAVQLTACTSCERQTSDYNWYSRVIGSGHLTQLLPGARPPASLSDTRFFLCNTYITAKSHYTSA